MCPLTVRFYEELNFFLPKDKQKQDISVNSTYRRSVKDLIESFGVPHTEVDLILVNGQSVCFNYIPSAGDRISVYPVFERLNISDVTRLRPEPLRVTKFMADVHLGALVRKLRVLGFDTTYDRMLTDPELASISQSQSRILLTRDRQLLMRSSVTHGLYVKNINPREQLAEVVDRLDLVAMAKPFSRCVLCNGEIAKVYPASPQYVDVLSRVPANIKTWCREFSQCGSCDQIFWKGSHYKALVRELSPFIRDLY